MIRWADLTEGWAVDGFGDTDALVNVTTIHATKFADGVTGSAADDFFQLFAGDDNVDGGDGWDTMDYSADIFFGASIADHIVADLAAVQARAVDDGSGVLITSDAGDSVYLLGVSVGQLSSSDFWIV